MRKVSLAALLLLLAALPARALVMAPAPIVQRVATSDVVIVGKVTEFEKKTVMAERFPGQGAKVEFRVALVKVKDPILGAKGLTHVKVAVWVPPPPPPPQPGRPVLPRRRYPTFNLKEGQEVCLFLRPHHKEAFYIGQNYFDVIDKKAPNFTKQVAEAKQYAKLLADPAAGLESKDAATRLDTAALLLMRHRMPRPGETKQEPIGAKESKQILQAIADADWTRKPKRPFELTPMMLFNYLGVTQQDGFTRPRNPRGYAAAAQKWVKENADTYRIKRYVAAKKK